MITKLWTSIVAQKATIILWAGIFAAGAAFVIGLIQWGKNIAQAECDSAAKQAQIETLQIDLKNANERAGRAEKIVAFLTEKQKADETEIRRLTDELKTAPRQSTKTGAKNDPAALLDDLCNYTARGARRVRP